MLRIIDNKRINLTDAEYQLYQEICRSYDAPNRKGEDLFKNLFETDKDGIILFLRPPTSNFSSLEVFLFLVSVMVHQHLGISAQRSDLMIVETQKTLQEAKELINELKSLRDSLVK